MKFSLKKLVTVLPDGENCMIMRSSLRRPDTELGEFRRLLNTFLFA